MVSGQTTEPDMSNSPRIRMLAVSSDYFPPIRVDVSVLFGEELARRRHRIDWILQSEAACDRPYSVEWQGSTVWVGATDLGQRLYNRVRKHVRGILNDLRLFSLLRGDRYDGIEVKDKFLSGVLALLAARMYRKRFIFWLSFPFPEEYLSRSRDPAERYALLYAVRGRVFSFLLYRVLLPLADHVFVQSEQMLRDVAEKGVLKSRLTAVPMGVRSVSQTPPEPVVERRLLPQGQPVVLYLGALDKVRRMDFLVRVHAQVLRHEPHAMLYLIGKSSHSADQQQLADEAARLGIRDSVVLVGQLPQAQALQYVREADVCVSPIVPSPFFNAASPTKLIEYMAMGKAVVANDHPEQSLVIAESGAGYAVPWDEAAFADAIVKLLRDPEGARHMGRLGWQYAARERVYRVIADRVEQQLLRVLGGSA